MRVAPTRRGDLFAADYFGQLSIDGADLVGRLQPVAAALAQVDDACMLPAYRGKAADKRPCRRMAALAPSAFGRRSRLRPAIETFQRP
jgi:hypothetical protein